MLLAYVAVRSIITPTPGLRIKTQRQFLPIVAVSLSTEGAIITEDTGPGGLAPHWTVKITVTYLDTLNTHQKPITFQTRRVSDDSPYQLRYLLDGQWRDAEVGVGCMLGIDLSRNSSINIADSGGRFASLHPGEVWEDSLSVFHLDWECPDDDGAAYVGDAFRLQYMGGIMGGVRGIRRLLSVSMRLGGF
ncbi:uncharacterized protein BJX67DRAFT_359112 [Aspergillus lucknowensis]|uniref:Uncharacterized protein n=1 Tax=Aspergillus lucknowensis TaxID=176173 RepID=A0ABR4LPG2_9EURO